VISNNSAIWVAGGFAGPNELAIGLEKYEEGIWKEIEVAFQMLAGMAAVPADRFNSRFLILGGSDGNLSSDRVLGFNSENSVFEEENFKLIHKRAGASACSYGDSFWVIGGGSNIGEAWFNGEGKETKPMPLSIYSQIEAAAFTKNKE
jgi:hypothetical protein